MTKTTPVRFAPTSDSSVTCMAARPKTAKVEAKVKRFLHALLRSLAAPAF